MVKIKSYTMFDRSLKWLLLLINSSKPFVLNNNEIEGV